MKQILLIFTLLCAHALNGMEPHSAEPDKEKVSPITLAQTYYYFAHDLLLPEIAQQIASFQLDTVDLVDLSLKIEQNRKSPEFLVKYLERLIASYGYLLASELCEHFLKQKKILLCDIQDEYKRTCLHHADRSPKVTAMFIKIAGDTASALIKMKTVYADTALHFAVCNNSPESVKLILDAAGLDAWKLLTMQNHNDWTALHCAAYHNSSESLKLILNAAGDTTSTLITMQNTNGQTALHYAANNNRTEIVKLILDAAGDTASTLITMPDNYGRMALDLANPEIKDVMKKYMPNK